VICTANLSPCPTARCCHQANLEPLHIYSKSFMKPFPVMLQLATVTDTETLYNKHRRGNIAKRSSAIIFSSAFYSLMLLSFGSRSMLSTYHPYGSGTACLSAFVNPSRFVLSNVISRHMASQPVYPNPNSDLFYNAPVLFIGLCGALAPYKS